MAKRAVKGMARLRKQFRELEPTFKEALGLATENTAIAIRAAAQARVPVRTGALRSAISHRFSTRTGFGRVGVMKGVIRGQRPSAYAHLIEFGTVHSRAQPYMLPAAEGEKAAYLERVRKAGQRAERTMGAKSGGRFV